MLSLRALRLCVKEDVSRKDAKTAKKTEGKEDRSDE
jgi:hypothetical protein